MSVNKPNQEELAYLHQMWDNIIRLLRMCKENTSIAPVVVASLGATLATVAVAYRYDFDIEFDPNGQELVLSPEQKQEVEALNRMIMVTLQ